jgi:hypothetical protein
MKAIRPEEMSALERAHVSYGLALGIARLQPNAIVALPVLTAELYDVMDEVVETTAVEVEEAERIIIVYAH